MASRLRRSILDNDSDDSKFDDDAIWLLAQFDASATADLPPAVDGLSVHAPNALSLHVPSVTIDTIADAQPAVVAATTLSIVAASAPAATIPQAAAANLNARGMPILDVGLQALALGASATAALFPVVGGLSVRHAPHSISPDGRYVTIDATAADGDGAALLLQLQAIGLQNGGSFKGMASGLLPVDQVGALLGIANLAHAHESGMIPRAGLVTNLIDVSVHADTARSTFAVNGTGITIGVLSDSFATSASPLTTMAQDIANDDLPANTAILEDFANGTDEGRAMAQIIHDLAPGASILFATANNGQASFASNIIALANAGAQVIVDDLIYFYEPMFQDGVIAQAVDQVVANGAIYFSAAGNYGHASYESPFISGGTGAIAGITETFHDFGTTVSGVPSTLLQINQDDDTTYIFQWANAAAAASPGVGAVTNLDFAGYSDAAATNEIFHFTNNEIGGDPINDLTLNGSATFYLRIGLRSGPAPVDLKIVAFNDAVTYGANSTNTNDGTVYGHTAAAGAIAVGAADYRQTPAFGTDPPLIEHFSSGGPTNIWVDTAGNILPAAQVRMTPAITAPDGGDTSFFFKDNSDPGTFPNFFGTSASAPAAAAVAALMLQARPALTRSDIQNLLGDSAIDMDNPATAAFDLGFDFGTGTGLIQADLAVGYASTLRITATAAHPLMYGTHLADTFAGGAENDTFTGFASVDTLVFAPGGLADTYTDFVAGAGGDIVDLSAFTDMTSLAAVLNQASQSGVDTVIDFGGGDRLTLKNAALSSLSIDNFVLAHFVGTPGDDHFTAPDGVAHIDALGGTDTISFGFRLLDATVSYVGNTVIIDGPSSHTVLSGFEVYQFTDGVVNDNDSDVLVDDLFYYATYHDVWNAQVDADLHYHQNGWHENRDPSAFFSSMIYLSANADVNAAGVDPLIQFDQFGWKEGRVPSLAFDDRQYLAANPDVAAAQVDPLAHFLAFGAQEGRQPFAPGELIAANGFDFIYYLQHNADVAAAQVDPFAHFETFGWKEGRNPNALFDTNGYLATYADVNAAVVNPLDHYNHFGWHEGRDPSLAFDTTSYLAAYPDVAQAGVNPLTHFLQFGVHEGRSPFADGVWG